MVIKKYLVNLHLLIAITILTNMFYENVRLCKSDPGKSKF